MSWESTVVYYTEMNRLVRDRRGGHHSASLLIRSVDFTVIQKAFASGWDEVGIYLAGEAAKLESAGAELILLCTNTIHIVSPRIREKLTVPFLHIVEPTANAVREKGIRKIGLLGTKPTMTGEFYLNELKSRGLEVLVPNEPDQDLVSRIIYDELTLGILRPESRAEYLRVIEELKRRGAEGVILGCTEIGLLVTDEHSPLPVFDTAVLHARAGALWALGEANLPE